jgi:hypothetical protein
MFGGEALRTLAHKIHMRTLGQNLSRRPHWIAHPLHAPDTPGPQRRPIHDERIQLHLAVAIQEATAAGVEGLVVFHDDNGFLDSIKRPATTLQHTPTRSESVANSVQVRLHHAIRHGPGAAVDYKDRISRQRLSSQRLLPQRLS